MYSLSVELPAFLQKKISFSTGELARQANGSVLVSYGDTVVLVTACMARKPREDGAFLPLSVDYLEKTYAMGKIPGGFIKREGRPKEAEILCARLIDRPLRPLFPEGFVNDIQIVAMVLSSDSANDPDVLAINGASCALIISDIPFATPVGAVRVGKVEDKLVVNPTYEQREKASFEVVVVATDRKVVMIEGKLSEAAEEDVVSAIELAHKVIREIIKVQLELREKAGKTKVDVSLKKLDDKVLGIVEERTRGRLDDVYGIADKKEREEAVEKILAEIKEEFADNEEVSEQALTEAFYKVEKEFVRSKIIKEGRRPDSRKTDEIRPIECKVSVLPRTHGAAIFRRGQTQSLAITTLGTSSDEQMVEALAGEKFKHFMLHYTFPPFSVGEVKPLRAPSRREIGHGALAEKALSAVIPPRDEFPYTIRVVSEILESNGSSSMATVCASSLSLMDAGVPIKEPVAGISIGLVEEGDEYRLLTDIAGVEDHYGDMDFKVAGTVRGITAIQMDVKNVGLTLNLIREALAEARKARLFILEKMKAALSTPRDGVSRYAPKIESFKIDIDKIGEVIGPGGRVIRRITRDYNVTIDIDDEEGRVSVVAESEEDLKKAVNTILALTREVNVGDVYDAKVVKITNFGAFCEIAPGKEGLLHISEISDKFVRDVRDFLKEGDHVKVKVINVDAQGKITLSKKQLE